METELEKKYEELVVYLKALTISHSPDEEYENRLLAEIAVLKEQQESKEHSEKLEEKTCKTCLYQFKSLYECSGSGCGSNHNKWVPIEQQPTQEAEDILQKNNIYQDAKNDAIGQLVLKAMQEYAQQGSKEQLIDWAYKMGLLLDKKIPFMGHDNLQRIEIAVRSYAHQGSEVTDEMIEKEAKEFLKTIYTPISKKEVHILLISFVKAMRDNLIK